MYSKLFFLLFVFINCLSLLYSQESFDSCNCEVDRILNTYKRLESKYKKSTIDKLLYFIQSDSVLNANFLQNDSSKFKNLDICIYPILKLSYEAKNFRYGENICKYFVFDTIDYDCEVICYINKRDIFCTFPLSNDCEYGIINPGGVRYSKEEKEMNISFMQSFYTDNKNSYYEYNIYTFNKHDSSDLNNSFEFFIDGLMGMYIKSNKISILLDTFVTDLKYLLELQNQPNKLISEVFSEEWIRYCARRCCPGCVPWWRFWDWHIFIKKPRWSND